jgi:hypothetical protein
MRSATAVLGGIVAWVVVATVGNFALRAVLPGYAGVEQAMTFTFDMQAGRLVVGALASFAAGFVAARVARGAGRAAWIPTIALVAVFIPVHYRVWTRFPLWYHLVFFASPLVATPAGAGRGKASATALPWSAGEDGIERVRPAKEAS